MIRAMWTAATGMTAQQLNVDTIANNLANVNTNAFKRSRAEFGDLLYQIQRLPGTNASNVGVFPVGVQVGGGVRPITVAKEWMQGNMRQTSNDLDLAIDGAGFFRSPGRTARSCIPVTGPSSATTSAIWSPVTAIS